MQYVQDAWTHYFEVEMHLTSQWDIYYVLTQVTNISLRNSSVLACVGWDGSEMAVCVRRFFVCQRFLASENGLYELASTFCHVGPGLQIIAL